MLSEKENSLIKIELYISIPKRIPNEYRNITKEDSVIKASAPKKRWPVAP